MGFAGRAADLDALSRSWDQARAGTHQVVIVRGAAGIGKTTLLAQLIADADCGCALVGTCQEDSSIPYLPIGSALRPLWPDEPGPFERLGGVRRETSSTPASPEARLDLVLEATSTLLARAASEPVLFAVDDVHWADAASVELLAHLLQALSISATQISLLVVLAMRPVGNDRPAARLVERALREPMTRVQDLAGLDLIAIDELVHGRTGTRPSKTLVRALLSSSGGNPLLVRSLVDRLTAFGGIAVRGNVLVQTSGAEPLASPRDLDELLRDRLADISETCRRVLVVAAFLGDNGSLGALESLAGLDAPRIERALDEARAAHLLDDDGSNYRFDHPQLRQVLYQMPRGKRRAELHLRIADHLESTGTPDDANTVIAIASQFRRAASVVEPATVERWSTLAAAAAVEQGAWAEAADAYEAALSAMDAQGFIDTASRALLETRAGYTHWWNHDNARALVHGEAAIAVARRLGDLELWAGALDVVARSLWAGAEMGDSGPVDMSPFDEFFAAARDSHRHACARVHHLAAVLCASVLDVHGAHEHVALARELSEGIVDGAFLCDLALIEGGESLLAGRMEAAVDSFRASAAMAAGHGDRLRHATAATRQAQALWMLGRLDEALSLAEVSATETAAFGGWAEHAVALSVICGIEGARGALERATTVGADARRITDWSQFGQAAAVVFPALAWAHSARGAFEEAHAALDAWRAYGASSAEVLRPLVYALAGERVHAERALEPLRPQAGPRSGLMWVYSLGVRVDVADLLDLDIDVSDAYALLSAIAETGMSFTTGWPLFLPRLAGSAARRIGDDATSERWFQRAHALATRAGAAIELERLAGGTTSSLVLR